MTATIARMCQTMSAFGSADPQIPLDDAMLCQDCSVISSGREYCTACGSASLLNLARVLNRTSEVPA